MRWISGFHAIEERLTRGGGTYRILCSGKGPRIKKILELAESSGVPVEHCPDSRIAALSLDARGILLGIDHEESTGPSSLEDHLESHSAEEDLVVLLDGVTDPHNLGAIVRCADQFGASLVAVPSRRSAHEGDAVERSSAGASAWVPIVEVPNLPRALSHLKREGYWIYGADMSGEPLPGIRFEGRIAIVLGSEGRGLSRLVRDGCDFIASIPRLGRLDSLNVSVACGVLLYAVRTQRG